MNLDQPVKQPNSAPASTPFSRWLDLFRWVAAFCVVLAHCENRFLVRIASVDSEHRTVLFYVFTFAAGFARQAVMIFFVLSGYLVGGSLWKESRKRGSIDLRRYLIHRFSRLCIVLYPTLLLIPFIDGVGIFGFHGIASGAYPADIMHSLRPSTMACNAVFLNTALCTNYGGDGALWSLYNEFWYYLAWPPILLGLMAHSAWKRTALFLTAGALLTAITVLQAKDSPSAGPYMLIWLLGVGVAAMPRAIIKSHWLSGALFLAALLAVRVFVRRSYGELYPNGMFLIDFGLSAFFANLLLSMKHVARLIHPPGKDINYTLAAFSFSFYCIHTPLLNMYRAAVTYYTGQHLLVPDSWWKWGIILGAIVFSVSVAFVFSRLTEAHTARLRDFLTRVLGSGHVNSEKAQRLQENAVPLAGHSQPVP